MVMTLIAVKKCVSVNVCVCACGGVGEVGMHKCFQWKRWWLVNWQDAARNIMPAVRSNPAQAWTVPLPWTGEETLFDSYKTQKTLKMENKMETSSGYIIP